MNYFPTKKKTLHSSNFVIAVVLAIVSVFFVGRPTQALTLIPPSVEFTAEPGQRIDTEIKLYNETSDSETLYPEVRNFSAEGETGTPTFDFTAELSGLATWFEYSTAPVVLAPGERLTIPVAINVPGDAEPGGQYAALFYGTQPPSAEGGAQIAVGSKIGTLFLVRVNGDIVENGAIAGFGRSADSSTTHLPITFDVRFGNTGNVHVRPTGTITITNMFGGTSATLDVNPSKGATLPSTIRNYQTTWEKAKVTTLSGSMWSDFWTELGNEWRNFAFGKYTAQVALSYGSTTPHQSAASVTFWIVPWRLLIISVIILAALVFGLIVGIKRYNSWIISKAQATK